MWNGWNVDADADADADVADIMSCEMWSALLYDVSYDGMDKSDRMKRINMR